jgi:ubiquinone/menaquinone biosynthesis C-methylase UbiE
MAENRATAGRPIVRWTAGTGAAGDAAWEAAYSRFETPAQEARKFLARLRRLGAENWPRDAQVVELFCGRGNGLVALERMGFRRLEGVDLSEALLSRYEGRAQLYLGDCRELGFESGSRDRVVVHGGLHHLPGFPGDVERVLAEVQRVLRPGGELVFVEPWTTPFLRFANELCAWRAVRRVWPRMDAMAEMNEREGEVYLRWLREAPAILAMLERRFRTRLCRERYGKLLYAGVKR